MIDVVNNCFKLYIALRENVYFHCADYRMIALPEFLSDPLWIISGIDCGHHYLDRHLYTKLQAKFRYILCSVVEGFAL